MPDHCPICSSVYFSGMGGCSEVGTLKKGMPPPHAALEGRQTPHTNTRKTTLPFGSASSPRASRVGSRLPRLAISKASAQACNANCPVNSLPDPNHSPQDAVVSSHRGDPLRVRRVARLWPTRPTGRLEKISIERHSTTLRLQDNRPLFPGLPRPRRHCRWTGRPLSRGLACQSRPWPRLRKDPLQPRCLIHSPRRGQPAETHSSSSNTLQRGE